MYSFIKAICKWRHSQDRVPWGLATVAHLSRWGFAVYLFLFFITLVFIEAQLRQTERTPRSSVVEKKRVKKFMPLIKKVAWPWRDVTPFVSPRELPSCARCVCLCADVCVVGECMHCGLGWWKWQIESEKCCKLPWKCCFSWALMPAQLNKAEARPADGERDLERSEPRERYGDWRKHSKRETQVKYKGEERGERKSQTDVEVK